MGAMICGIEGNLPGAEAGEGEGRDQMLGLIGNMQRRRLPGREASGFVAARDSRDHPVQLQEAERARVHQERRLVRYLGGARRNGAGDVHPGKESMLGGQSPARCRAAAVPMDLEQFSQ